MFTRLKEVLRWWRERRATPAVPGTPQRNPEYCCLYCDRPYADDTNWPYCTSECSARAEAER